MKLYGYWRSSATYRLRLALALKGLEYSAVAIDLAAGEQRDPDFIQVHRQGLVPVLELADGTCIAQSQAILDYLDAAFPQKPLLPPSPVARAQSMAFGAAIACEIHPLGNISVQKYVGQTYGVGRKAGPAWAAHWIARGFEALEALAQERSTRFLFGEEPGYAECFLVPQVYNAYRYNVPMSRFPALSYISRETLAWPGLAATAPEAQPEAAG